VIAAWTFLAAPRRALLAVISAYLAHTDVLLSEDHQDAREPRPLPADPARCQRPRCASAMTLGDEAPLELSWGAGGTAPVELGDLLPSSMIALCKGG
jgi:hypothetical protein